MSSNKRTKPYRMLLKQKFRFDLANAVNFGIKKKFEEPISEEPKPSSPEWQINPERYMNLGKWEFFIKVREMVANTNIMLLNKINE